MTYTPLFDVKKLEIDRPRLPKEVAYVYTGDLELAVNVALAAKRPLLLSGLPGTGKSSLAKDVAWKLGRRYYEQSITSRTSADDLQWSYDAVRKLSLAAGHQDVSDERVFTRPGVLWRAFRPDLAKEYGDEGQQQGPHAVVLLDEIDKAEPDVPNDLLVVIDRRHFTVRETGLPVVAPDDRDALIVFTTNGERDLPPAFLRRCICYTIQLPEDPITLDASMLGIAARHFPAMAPSLREHVYRLYTRLRGAAAKQSAREPSTAELLDAMRAIENVGITEPDERWDRIATAAMWKHDKPPQTGP